MKHSPKITFSTSCLWVLLCSSTVQAGEVTIVAAEFRHQGGERWSVDVTLKHADSGWDHYADGWRVVDADGELLGERVLHHPHVNEQPFTRGLSSVTIPASDTVVYLEAHDKRHGWAPTRLAADLGQAVDGRLTVEPR